MYLSVSIACFALSLLISTVFSIFGTGLVSHFRFHFSLEFNNLKIIFNGIIGING